MFFTIFFTGVASNTHYQSHKLCEYSYQSMAIVKKENQRPKAPAQLLRILTCPVMACRSYPGQVSVIIIKAALLSETTVIVRDSFDKLFFVNLA